MSLTETYGPAEMVLSNSRPKLRPVGSSILIARSRFIASPVLHQTPRSFMNLNDKKGPRRGRIVRLHIPRPQFGDGKKLLLLAILCCLPLMYSYHFPYLCSYAGWEAEPMDNRLVWKR